MVNRKMKTQEEIDHMSEHSFQTKTIKQHFLEIDARVPDRGLLS